jgi:uncharacterized protein (TIGR04255 family)
MGKKLKNKPLIEALFELRWALKELTAPQVFSDPNYSLLIGRLYDRIREQYPHHEQLPSADIPEPMAAYMVQHRFRVAQDDWPLVQVGPGVITLNDTVNYTWTDFYRRILGLLDAFYAAYPRPSELSIVSVALRYIDGIPFDFSENVLSFFSREMKLNVSLQDQFFIGTAVDSTPLAVDIKLVYPSAVPKGTISMQFARGHKQGRQDALIWDTIVQSTSADAPRDREELKEWSEAAHALISDWFFKTIAGNLERRFQ